MNGEFIAFVLLSASAIVGAILMISLTKVMHMIISLSLTFLSIAGIYVLLSAEFVAVVQLLIYSGAITIIMLFGIMLTNHDAKHENEKINIKKLTAFIGVVLIGVIVYIGIQPLNSSSGSIPLHEDNTKEIGKILFSQYVIPFELISVLLLVALVGAVILAKNEEGHKDE